MKKLILLAILLAWAGTALADQVCEGFPDPLSGWTTRYLGLHTNLENYYVCAGNPDQNDRGNNPCGLWICTTANNSNDADVIFDSYGQNATNFTLDVVPFVNETYTIYNWDGSVAFTQNLAADGVFPPCDSNTYGSNCVGLSHFSLTGSGVEGNTSIDNVCITRTQPVPVREATWGSIKNMYH